MKLVVGLGNPGPGYAGTRHNVGFRVVERFAACRSIALDQERFDCRFGTGRIERGGLGPLEVTVLEPLTWMNRSGSAVARALRGLAIEDVSSDLLVVFDDVDLPTGRLRLRPRGGSGGHRGLADVIATLGGSDFARLRFGVGRPEGLVDTADWVLAPFSSEEEETVRRSVEAAAEAVEVALLQGIAPAMDRFNPDPAGEA